MEGMEQGRGGAAPALTARQERFVRALAAGQGPQAAYAAAYDTARLRPETVEARALALAEEERVRARLEALRAPRPAPRRSVASAQEVLEELTDIALGSGGAESAVRERLRALELLGRHHRLFLDRPAGGEAAPVQIVDDVEAGDG